MPDNCPHCGVSVIQPEDINVRRQRVFMTLAVECMLNGLANIGREQPRWWSYTPKLDW